MWVQSPGSGRSPGGGHATHFSILAWRIPWIEDPGGLQSMGLQRVGHDWAYMHRTHFLDTWVWWEGDAPCLLSDPSSRRNMQQCPACRSPGLRSTCLSDAQDGNLTWISVSLWANSGVWLRNCGFWLSGLGPHWTWTSLWANSGVWLRNSGVWLRQLGPHCTGWSLA